jgi:hypothetical protein
MKALKEGTTMTKLLVMLLGGTLVGLAWLLPVIAEARLASNHNETLLAAE